MKTQAVLQPGRLTPTLQESERWGHTAVHPVAQDITPATEKLTRLNTDQNFSNVPVYRNGNSQSETACPLSPRTCPFGGACHTCLVHIQPKLKISQPDDEYEREADRVADLVMRMPEPKEDEQEKCPGSVCARVLQRRATGRETPEEIPPIVQEVLHSPGRPLDAGTRAFMEPRFGRDFSRVRIHADTQAAESAEVINSLAYTVGEHIVLGAGQGSLGTPAGRKCLTHELAHTLQQSRAFGSLALQRAKPVPDEAVTDPVCDLELILGTPVREQSINYKQNQLLSLQRYLKRVRRVAPEKEDLLKGLLEVYFPGFGDVVWKDSEKSLAGYTGSSFGVEAGKYAKQAEERGLTRQGKTITKKQFIGSDVIFFSGHHFARLGFPGAFEGLDVSEMRFVSPRVKLIIISSCAGLEPSAIALWKKRFPNAYILGWREGAPLEQKGMVGTFVTMLPEGLLLEDNSDIKKIIDVWRGYVETLARDPKAVVNPWGLGYATPEGIVRFYIKERGAWKWVTRRR